MAILLRYYLIFGCDFTRMAPKSLARDRLHLVSGIEFEIKIFDVRFYGVLRNGEDFGNFCVRIAHMDQFEKIQFLSR
ncbi:MAG: hypothetical protein ABIY70_28460 [Capsulimonas sp.]|uniref:hypothetical protein n=1 Tax=Capsulimonas sp. TaxID=2494211 RepID=UPI0032654DEC